MKEILELRAKSGSSSWRKENLYPRRLEIEEKGMRFCWLNAYIKFYEDYSDGKVIYDIKKGVYEDVDWYEYILPENNLYQSGHAIWCERSEFLKLREIPSTRLV